MTEFFIYSLFAIKKKKSIKIQYPPLKMLNWKAQQVPLSTDDSSPWPHTHTQAHKPRQWTEPCTACSLNSSFMHHLSQFGPKTFSSILVSVDTHARISACRFSRVEAHTVRREKTDFSFFFQTKCFFYFNTAKK